MELQFDKEMDAILRKARNTRGVLVGDSPPEPKKHLDADALAAFAENALPVKARSLYMEHFADCDGCRKMLSNVILANTEAVAATASSSALAPAAEAVVPWYLKIFRTPNLALAMGALVLTFGGILGYVVLQNRNPSAPIVATMKDVDRPNGGPYTSGITSSNSSANAPASNSAANVTNMAAANIPAMSAPESKTASGPSADSVGRPTDGAPGGLPEESDRRLAASGGVSPEPAKPATVAAAPAPPPVDQPVQATRDDKKAGEDKLKDESTADTIAKEKAPSKADGYDRSREAPMAAKKASGPSRASVQNNTQQQEMNNLPQQNASGMIATTKSAGGKTFVNRNGAWYDTAYHSQSTIDVRRGTDTYKKLDGGLRKIGDTIGGTVVVVWKSKAYRIQ